MQSNQKLDSFISEITSGDPTPIADSDEQIEERVWSGAIAEIAATTFNFYKTDNASPSGARKEAAGEASGTGSDGAKTDGKPAEAKPDAKAPATSEKKPSPESKPAPKSGDAKPAPWPSKP